MMQDFPDFDNFDSERLGELDESLWEVSEMIRSERLFLNGIIRYFRPKKLLEVGVAAGGSSAIILNAIRDIDGAALHSHDLASHYYRDPTKATGFAVQEHCADLTKGWDLKTGGLIARHIEEIGGGIDFLLLDTAHANPGEFLDLLVALPYLKPGAIVVIHDISLHLEGSKYARLTTCGTLYAALKGRKFTPAQISHDIAHKEAATSLTLPNIGAVILPDKPMETALDLLHLVSLPWCCRIPTEEIDDTAVFLGRHYGEQAASKFKAWSSRPLAQSPGHTETAHHLNNANPPTTRSKLFILGIPLIKVINYGKTIEVLLFSTIPILKISRKLKSDGT